MKEKPFREISKDKENTETFPRVEELEDFLSLIDEAFRDGLYETVNLELDDDKRVQELTFIIRDDERNEEHYHYRRGSGTEKFLAALEVSSYAETDSEPLNKRVIAVLMPDGWIGV